MGLSPGTRFARRGCVEHRGRRAERRQAEQSGQKPGRRFREDRFHGIATHWQEPPCWLSPSVLITHNECQHFQQAPVTLLLCLPESEVPVSGMG